MLSHSGVNARNRDVFGLRCLPGNTVLISDIHYIFHLWNYQAITPTTVLLYCSNSKWYYLSTMLFMDWCPEIYWSHPPNLGVTAPGVLITTGIALTFTFCISSSSFFLCCFFFFYCDCAWNLLNQSSVSLLLFHPAPPSWTVYMHCAIRGNTISFLKNTILVRLSDPSMWTTKTLLFRWSDLPIVSSLNPSNHLLVTH